jgi:general secretion pathway protein I
MSRTKMYPDRYHSCSTLGLTLIEVLIALAIISIAMTAVIKASSQNIRSTAYLQNKTIAMWVGQQALNEVRAGVLKLPNSDTTKETTNMLGHEWYWEVDQAETPNKRINQIRVRVFADEKDEESTPLLTLETYLYHAE